MTLVLLSLVYQLDFFLFSIVFFVCANSSL